MLCAARTGAELLGWGVNGNTTSGTLAVLSGLSVREYPDAVSLIDGTNDIAYGGDLASVRANMGAMVHLVIAGGGLPPIGILSGLRRPIRWEWVELMPERAAELLVEYQSWLRRFAAAFRLPALDFDRAFVRRGGEGLSQPDGLHPNTVGHCLMVETAAAFIRSLRKKGTCVTMCAIQSPSTDPRFNLALERYIFDQIPRNRFYPMLWRNDRTIAAGKHQDTFAEINADYAWANWIQVVCRLSGGGAVYYDLGNVNFTFIADHTGSDFDFPTFCRPVIWALESLGVPAELNGRNDMTIRGRKFPGNSRYVKEGRVMHHGISLYDSDLSVTSSALASNRDKLTSEGLPSVRSRTTNIKLYTHQPVSTKSFMERPWSCLGEVCDLVPYELDRGDLSQVERTRQAVHNRWGWNYGSSPQCQTGKRRRIEDCGEIRVYLDLKGGAIQALSLHGDFFLRKEPDQLARRLIGCPLREEALWATVPVRETGQYFQNMDLDEFCGLILC